MLPKDIKSRIILISVQDRGIGLSEEDANKLFSPFFRSSDKKSKKRNPNGNGLGLSICRNVARNLGGDITFSSALGEGSTFVFTFEAGLTQVKTPVPSAARKKKSKPLKII